jgi:hypothetical protein
LQGLKSAVQLCVAHGPILDLGSYQTLDIFYLIFFNLAPNWGSITYLSNFAAIDGMSCRAGHMDEQKKRVLNRVKALDRVKKQTIDYLLILPHSWHLMMVVGQGRQISNL